MAGEGAGAELRLRVSLDLTSLRRQLATIGTQLAGQALPLQVRFDRTSISKEFRLLNRYIGGKKFNIEINTNLKTELDRARQLAEAIKAIPGGGGAMRAPGTVEQGFSQAQLRKLRQDIKPLYKAAATAGLVAFEEAIANNTKKIAKELSGVGKSSIAGLLNGLKSGDPQLEAAAKSLGKILINTIKAVLGIASPSKETGKLGKFAGQGFEKGFIAGMIKAERAIARAVSNAAIAGIYEGLTTIGNLAPAFVPLERALAAQFQRSLRKAMLNGMKASIMPGLQGGLLGATGGGAFGALVGGGRALGGVATTGLTQLGAGGLLGAGKQLGRLAIGDTSGLTTFVQEAAAQAIHQAFSTGTLGALIGAAAVGGVAASSGFVKGSVASLMRQTVEAIINKIARDIESTIYSFTVGNFGPSIGKSLQGVVQALIRDLESRVQSMNISFPSMLPALPPAYRGLPGAGDVAGMLPPAYRGLPGGTVAGQLPGTAAPAGLLPSISQTTARRTSIATGLEAIFAAGGPPGKLALTPEALKRRVDAILAEYFRVVETQVRDIFAAPALPKYTADDLHLRVLQMLRPLVNAFEEAIRLTNEAKIDRKVDLFFDQIDKALQFAQAQVGIRMSRIGELTGRALPAPQRIAGLLPPVGGTTPPGATRFNVVRTGDVVPPQQLKLPPGRARILGEQPFMTAPSIGGGGGRGSIGGSFLTGKTPGGFRASGADIGAFVAGAEKALRYEKALEIARKSLENFRVSQLPLVGGLRELSGEFSMAIKQVLLYGAAYRGLAFITSLPGQILNAAKGQQQFANAMQVATQETNTFAKEMLYVDNVQRAFGLNLETTRSGFTRLYASMAPAGFDSGSIEKLFTGISAASAALQLTPDKAERVIYAFGQMASKGQVMSEELKGQLGDVLPGALAIFAKAAGKSVKEFNKEIEDGIYSGSKFRELMAGVTDELIRRFGTAAQVAGKSLQGLLNTVQGEFIRTLEALTPLANTAAQSILGPLGGALKQFSTAARVAMGETTMITKQIADAEKAVKDLKDGGADASQIRGAEQSLAALQARQEQFNVALQDPAVRKQAEEIKAFIGEMVKLGNIITNVANIIGSILNPIFTFLGTNLATVITVVGSLMLGFNAMRLSLTVASGALVIFNGLVKAVAGGTVGINALAMVFQTLGVQISAANIKAIGFGATMRALLISSGVGALVVLLGSLAAVFLTVGNNARKAAAEARRSVQAIREAAAAGDVATIQMREAMAKADLQAAKALQKGIAGMGTGAGRSGKQIAVSKLEPLRGQFATLGIQLPAKGTTSASKLAAELDAKQRAAQSVLREVEIVGPAAAARRKAIGLDQPTPSPAPPETPSAKSGGSSKAENAAKRLAEQIAQQAQAAADALFNEQQRLAIMQATDPTAKALTEYASQELVIERELNKALADAKSEKEKQDRLAEANIKRQANALTLDQQLADARKQAMQPLEDTLRNQREQLLVETDIKNLVAQGMVPERAKEVAEIRKLTRAALEQIDAQIKQFDLSIDTAKAALEEAKARGASAEAVANMVKNLDELEKRRKKAEEDRRNAQGKGTEAEAGVPPTEAESYISKGYEDAMKNLKQLTDMGYQMVEAAGAIGDAFGTAFKQIITGSATAQEAFAGLFRSVADHFADMVAKMIAEWLKAQLIKGFMNIISGLIPGAGMLGGLAGGAAGFGGSFNSGIAPLPNAPNYSNVFGISKFANGGIVTGPTLGLVGEGRYNEAIVPLPNGRSIPVDLGGASAATNVVINVDAKGTSVAGDQGSAQALARDLASVVDQRIIYHKRAGGLLSR